MCSVNLTSMGFVKSVAHNIPSWFTCWTDFHLQNVAKLHLSFQARDHCSIPDSLAEFPFQKNKLSYTWSYTSTVPKNSSNSYKFRGCRRDSAASYTLLPLELQFLLNWRVSFKSNNEGHGHVCHYALWRFEMEMTNIGLFKIKRSFSLRYIPQPFHLRFSRQGFRCFKNVCFFTPSVSGLTPDNKASSRHGRLRVLLFITY